MQPANRAPRLINTAPEGPADTTVSASDNTDESLPVQSSAERQTAIQDAPIIGLNDGLVWSAEPVIEFMRTSSMMKTCECGKQSMISSSAEHSNAN